MTKTSKSYFVVTDGDTVLGTFNTAHAAERYLREASTRLLSGAWVSPRQAGFYISIRS